MTHIAVRRLALSAAAVSFSFLTALVLYVSAAYTEDAGVFGEVAQLTFSQEAAVQFPYQISCTDLVVEQTASYDGPFYEDGTGREVLGVASILLRNTSSEMIPYAHVVLRTDTASYIFDCFWLPAGAAVLIPEKYALSWESQAQVISCFGWSTVTAEKNPCEISVEDVDMGKLCVRNLSGGEIRNLTLYHKTYLRENDMYIGGAVFETRIDSIGAGENVIISPRYYASGYSKIVYYE